MRRDDKIFITNHEKMPGRAFVRILKERGFDNLILRSEEELDLLDQHEVSIFFRKEKPDFVILSSIKSGGIKANIDHPADFIHDNLRAQINVINSSKDSRVKRLLYIASSCVYPRGCRQPMREAYLLTGRLEPTNEPYAIAKIAGIKMCQAYNRQYKTDFISLIPSDLYGPGYDFDVEASHVVSALMKKFHEGKIENEDSVTIWGSGKPKRDFLYIDDFIKAALFLMAKPNLPEIINIGTGTNRSIRKLAELIKDLVGFKGKLKFDTTKPDGMPKKILDPNILNSLGWRQKEDLLTGLDRTYQWYNRTFK